MRFSVLAAIAASFVCVGAASAAPTTPVAPSVSNIPPPRTQPGKTLVTLGDSFTANGVNTNGNSETGVCQRGPASWPKQLGRLMGVVATHDYADVSCSGASIDTRPGWTLTHEVAKAATEESFGPRTKLVAIQTGFNDTWGANGVTLMKSLMPCILNYIQGCGLDAADQNRMPDHRGVTGQSYADRIRANVEYIRYHAPKARIVLVGYPELFPARQDVACLEVLGVGRIVQPRGRGIVEYLDRLDTAQREATAALKIDFFDTRALTTGHGSCSAQPWLNGIADPRGDLVGIPAHPSAHGDAMLANALLRWITR